MSTFRVVDIHPVLAATPRGVQLAPARVIVDDDAQPTTARCPRCDGDGLVRCAHDPRDEACFACWVGATCPACDGGGWCEPIPAKGRQQIGWPWTPEAPA